MVACVLVAIGALWASLVDPAGAAEPTEADPVRYAVVNLAEPGSRVLLYFEVKNTGAQTWLPGQVALVNTRNPLGAAPRRDLHRSVFPNETAYWDFEVAAPRSPGVHESRWEIHRSGGAISPRMTVYVIVVPPEANELRAKIQKLIDEWQKEHGTEVEALMRQIADLLRREGGGLLGRLIASRCGLSQGMLVLLAVALAARHRPV
jgi:hypothetical protein